jgi:hypothetical protein
MKNALLAVPLLAAGMLAAGCGTSSSTPAAGAPATGASGSQAASGPAPANSAATTPAATAPSSAPAATAAAAGASACTSAGLKVSIGGGAGAGMSQNHVGLQFTNAGPTACTLYGYPGVSWVAGADGHQVGAGATRQADPTGNTEQTVTLAPGALASAPLDIVDAGVFPPAQCKPVPVRGLRIYPPGETAALFIPMPTTAGGYGECSGTTGQPSLFIGYLQPGAQPS